MFHIQGGANPISSLASRSPAGKRRSYAWRPSLYGLERRELLTPVVVSGQANIYGAGHTAPQQPPDPGGGGGGVLPPEVDLSTLGNSTSVDFPTVTGTVSGWAAAGGFNGPDGGPYWGGVTNVPAWGGISGIRDDHATMFLVGVFLGPTGQPKSAPPTPNVTSANNFATFSPIIGQQFFIGDGRTTSKAIQTFNVPAGATRLYLGFAEGWGFGNPRILPGFYSDNGGFLSVAVARPVELDVNGMPHTQNSNPAGLVVMNADNNGAPRAEITIEPSPFDLLLTENNSKVALFTTPSGGTALTFNGKDNLFPKNGPVVHLYVQGSQYSDAMRDVTLTLATAAPGSGSDQAKFTVLWVDQPTVDFSKADTVSADNTARATYASITANHGYNLGLQYFTTIEPKTGAKVTWVGWGYQTQATVHPSDFNYPMNTLTLDRTVESSLWYGTYAKHVNTIDPTHNDHGLPVYHDDTPSSKGIIYDLDTPGPVTFSVANAYIQRVRDNFNAYASITINVNGVNTVVRASKTTSYFVDLSIDQTASPQGTSWAVLYDIKGDNQAAYGTTKLTWNLM